MLLLVLACSGGDVSVGDTPATPSDPDPTPAERAPDAPAWTVDCGGAGDFATIGEAIAAASPGDTIAVAPCTYEESIDFGGKALTIESTGGSSVTTIRATSGAAVRAETGEGPGTALVGFTISGGGGRADAAVVVDLAALRLEDVVLTDNDATVVVHVTSGDLELRDVTISGNTASYGYTLIQSKGSVVWRGGALDCDGATYGLYLGHGSALVDDVTVSCGRNVGAYWEHEVGKIQRSVIEGSVAVESEDDHYDDFLYVINSVVTRGVSATYGSLWVRNSVVYGGVSLNQAFTYTVIEGSVVADAACGVTTETALSSVRNNLFYGVTSAGCGLAGWDPLAADGNFAGDPQFADAANGDWSLAAGSPARDAGPQDGGYEDVDGTPNDIGVYGGPFSIGGGW